MHSVVIIGGGAAGCFCAAELSSLHPDWSITVLEAGPRPMAKLAITGGGRCNITNRKDASALKKCYHEAEKFIYPALKEFLHTAKLPETDADSGYKI